MAASRVLVALIAESVTEVDEHVTAAQMRILVLVSRAPGTNLSAVAEALGVHASNATRACDRLVRAGLLSRTESEHDRRHLHLALTDAGRDLLERVMNHRRAAFEDVLRRMEAADRETLTTALAAFAAAAGEHPGDGAWSP
jgi:DNA-binding MarR family transcriptional regulator